MTESEIIQIIKDNPVVLFGKGEKGAPRCGFTANMQNIFDELYPEYVAVNVLGIEGIRDIIKNISDWPTFPQIFINENFIGGGDIVTEMYEEGELQKLLIGEEE